MDFQYGDAFEQFPMAEGEIWQGGECFAMVGDVQRGDLPGFLKQIPPVHVVYSDPPWNSGNATAFRTKAHREAKVDFARFMDDWTRAVTATPAEIFFVEMGKQNIGLLVDVMKLHGVTEVGRWQTLYNAGGKYLPCYLWCGLRGRTLTGYPPFVGEPTDLHGEAVVHWALSQFNLPETGLLVLDPCAGLGMTFRVGIQLGLAVAGMELNERRLANVLVHLNRTGRKVVKVHG